MGHAPVESVYGLTPRDLAGGVWGPLFREGSASDTATLVNLVDSEVFSPPVGYVGFIDMLHFYFNPGAGQKVTGALALIQDFGAQSIFTLFSGNIDAAADEEISMILHPDIPIVGGVHRVSLAGIFDAGVASNIVSMSLAATVVPKGNITLF